MRQGVKTIFASLVAGVVLVPGALAASPQDIYRDLADNGKLDGTYTQAELQAFLHDASVQGYGNPIVVTVTPPKQTITPPATGVAGVATPPAKKTPKPQRQPRQAPPQVAGVQTPPVAETGTVDTLPFTGSELGLFALVGGALLLGGVALRASARRR